MATLSNQNQQIQSQKDTYHEGGHKKSKLMKKMIYKGQFNALNQIQCNHISKPRIGHPQTFWWGKTKEMRKEPPSTFKWPLDSII